MLVAELAPDRSGLAGVLCIYTLVMGFESQLATGFSGGKVRYWLIVYTGLLVWNVLTTWWVEKQVWQVDYLPISPTLHCNLFLLCFSEDARRHLNRKAA